MVSAIRTEHGAHVGLVIDRKFSVMVAYQSERVPIVYFEFAIAIHEAPEGITSPTARAGTAENKVEATKSKILTQNFATFQKDLQRSVFIINREVAPANVPVERKQRAVGRNDRAAGRKQCKADQCRSAKDMFRAALGSDPHDPATAGKRCAK